MLTDEQKGNLRAFFRDWGKLLFETLVPGAHGLITRALPGISLEVTVRLAN